jgi:hypothetical protein
MTDRDTLIADLLLYLDNRDVTAQFDAIAEKFYQETGFLRPGKSAPMEMSAVTQRRREDAWATWCAQWRQKLIDGLLTLVREDGPQDAPLVAYMNAETREQRSAAFLRTYAQRVRDRTAVSWEIPNTVATTLEDIAALLESKGSREDGPRLHIEAERDRLREAVRWALGEVGEFGEEPAPLAGKHRRRFWWRKELRARAFGADLLPHEQALQTEKDQEAVSRAEPSSAGERQDPREVPNKLTPALVAASVEEHIVALTKAGKQPSRCEIEMMRSWPQLLASGDRHPWHGPCDGIDNGECSECQRLTVKSKRGFDAELTEHIRALVGNRQFVPVALYNPRIDLTWVIVRDCSFYEETPNSDGIALLRDNYDGGNVVGLHFYGRLDGVVNTHELTALVSKWRAKAVASEMERTRLDDASSQSDEAIEAIRVLDGLADARRKCADELWGVLSSTVAKDGRGLSLSEQTNDLRAGEPKHTPPDLLR